MLTKIFRYLYLVVIWAYLAGVIYQVYMAGLAAVAKTTGWDGHIGFGLLLVLTSPLPGLIGLPARLPRPAGWVNLALFVCVIAQFLVLGNRDSELSALHPVLALLTFSLSWWLARAALRAVRLAPPAAAVMAASAGSSVD